MLIEQQRPQSLRRAVHRRRKTGRTGADDDEIVEIEGRQQWTAQTLGDLPRLRRAQYGSVFEEQRRKLVRAYPGRVRERTRIRIPCEVKPAIGDQVARKEVLDRMR